MAGRRTNLALLGLLAGAFVTGWLAFGVGADPPGSWVVVTHGALGLALVLLAPWKSLIVRRGLRRRRSGRTVSLALSLLVVAAVLSGVGHASGLLVRLGPITAMQLHVGAAILAIPVALWHVRDRRTWPRRQDVSRRNALRALAVLGGGLVAVVMTEGMWRLAGTKGARRRFTGSYQVPEGAALPVTQWLDDRVPRLDRDSWRLTIRDHAGERALPLSELIPVMRVETVIDCTGGWYARRSWSGVPLDRLIRPAPEDRSVFVRSVTGYGRRFPLSDLPRLLLATHLENEPLPVGNGFPVRLVAPGRRGFWWVKWVVEVEADRRPWWAQLPFPAT